jgi:hypothetical protein
MDCYYCDRQAGQECPRCGALYCDQHGDALCQRCLDPVLALPSYRVYRGSLLTLLIGTIFAVWLLVKPPSTDADSPLPPAISGALRTPVAAAEASPEATPAAEGAAAPPAAGPPPAVTATPTATPTPTALEYRVVAGDSLTSIAAEHLPAGKSLATFMDEIQRANGITNAGSITVGQTIRVPR